MKKKYPLTVLPDGTNKIDWRNIPGGKGFRELIFHSYMVPFENCFQLALSGNDHLFCRFTGTLPENPVIADSYKKIVKIGESMSLYLRNPEGKILEFLVSPKGAVLTLISDAIVDNIPVKVTPRITGEKFEIVMAAILPPEFKPAECDLRVFRSSLALFGGAGQLLWEGDDPKTAWHKITLDPVEEKELNQEVNASRVEDQETLQWISKRYKLGNFSSSTDFYSRLRRIIHGITEEKNRVDFSGIHKKFRRIHGTNLGPNLSSGKLNDCMTDFQECKFSTSRLHDAPLQNPGRRIVDIDQIFGRQDADPADPGNYYFEQTDDYLKSIIDSGSQIVYRLGNSIEWSRKLYFAKRPADYERFAEVCAGIIRHCNHGWANGFRHNILYWEIWNEADHPCMWDGSAEDYFKLYKTVVLRLKKEFPYIKVGGPAATKIGSSLCSGFIRYCAEEKLPLDFFSYHCYATDHKAWIESVNLARIVLDMHGFKDTEIHLNEWHYRPADATSHNLSKPEAREKFYSQMNGVESAAFSAACLLRAQDSPLTVSNFYLFGSGLYGMYDVYGRPFANLHAMKKIGLLFSEYPNRLECAVCNGSTTISGGFSADGKRAALLVSSFISSDKEIEIDLINLKLDRIKVWSLTEKDGFQPVDFKFEDGRLALRKSDSSAVYWIEFSD